MGLRVQMGHSGYQKCGSPLPGHQDFTVIHTNGLHQVAVDFCGCSNRFAAGEHRQQLMRMSWYPSTDAEPQTAATFRVLEMFHIMTLQGKVTTYDFYSGLEKMTDNTGMTKMKVLKCPLSSICEGLTILKGPLQVLHANDEAMETPRHAETRRTRK
jgi:hypothetical protein